MHVIFNEYPVAVWHRASLLCGWHGVLKLFCFQFNKFNCEEQQHINYRPSEHLVMAYYFCLKLSLFCC